MKAKELKELLDAYPDDMEVVLSDQTDGTGFRHEFDVEIEWWDAAGNAVWFVSDEEESGQPFPDSDLTGLTKCIVLRSEY
jgi:hypothetical protein